MTPEDINKKEFTTVRLREGYDPDEVDTFLDEVSATMSEMARDIEDLTRTNTNLERKLLMPADAPTAQLAVVPAMPVEQPEVAQETVSVTASRLLELAQETAEKLVGEATAAGVLDRENARQESARVVAEAALKADALRQEGEMAYNTAIGQLEIDKDRLVTAIEGLKTAEYTIHERIRSFLTHQLGQVPEVSTEPDQEPS